jgi:hypothetical protein
VPYIPSVFLLREKVTLRCDVLGTTYRNRAKHFLCPNCVKYTAAHRPRTTNHTSTFNSQIRLTRTDHTLTIKTQTNTPSNLLQLQASWSLIKYKLILGHMQHIALLSNLYVIFTRLLYVALLFLSRINAALQIWSLLLFLPTRNYVCNIIFLFSNLFSLLNSRDER